MKIERVGIMYIVQFRGRRVRGFDLAKTIAEVVQ